MPLSLEHPILGAVGFPGNSAVLDASTRGIIGDDSTLNGVAMVDFFEEAKDQGMIPYFPPGRYRYEIALNILNLPGLLGVPEETFFIPTAAVASPCLSFSTSDLTSTGYPRGCWVSGIILDGSLTSGKVGLKVGHAADSVVSARINFHNVTSQYFEDAGGIALQVADVVNPTFQLCRWTRSHINVLIDADDAALPTLPDFYNNYINYATTKGLKIVHAYLPRFGHCVFEANGEEGTLLDPGAGETILKAVFDTCWWESNWGGDTTKYSFKADGTGATCQPHLIEPYFWSTNLVEKAAQFIACTDYILDAPFVRNHAGLISFDANCQGYITNWDENSATMLTTIANASSLSRGIRNSGQEQITIGNTSVTVTHGLGAAPNGAKIRIVPANGLGSATKWWVSNIGATTFDINVNVDPATSGAVFNWDIEL